MDLISIMIVDIYEDLKRQIERDLSDLNAFLNGIMTVKPLKAKERFVHVSYLIYELCTKR